IRVIGVSGQGTEDQQAQAQVAQARRHGAEYSTGHMTAPAGEIQIGTVVAETYEVTRLLGQGGMGAVWEATHRRLPGKRVAIKVLLNVSKDEEQLARFKREAEIASRL